MTDHVFGGGREKQRPVRPVFKAIRRGLSGRCPACSEGRLFRKFLKTVHSCNHCGEEIHHHRADDLPAYLVVAIVGHIVVGGFAIVEAAVFLPVWLHLAIWVPLTVLLSLLLVQPIKGAVVGLQWALYMHGFGGEHDAIESHPEM